MDPYTSPHLVDLDHGMKEFLVLVARIESPLREQLVDAYIKACWTRDQRICDVTRERDRFELERIYDEDHV